MAIIAPNSRVFLYHNVPIHKDYENSLYSANASEQFTKFDPYMKYSIFPSSTGIGTEAHYNNQYTYIREKQAIRVELLNDDLYDINYMIYQNTSFGTKYFYAFVTKTEYVNNGCTYIYFELDVLQTWFHDLTFLQCVIERETVLQDFIGYHTLSEPISFNDYIEVKSQYYPISLHECQPCVYCTFTESGGVYTDITASYDRGVIVGYTKRFFTSELDCINWINAAVAAGKKDGILAVRMVPVMFPSGYEYPVTKLNGAYYTPPVSLKNNKCYTYPYFKLEAYTPEGRKAEFMYERFNNGNDDCVFKIKYTQNLEPSVAVIPYKYNGEPDTNYDNALYVDNFPECSFASDKMLDYIGQHTLTLATSVIKDSLLMALGGVNPFFALAGLSSEVSTYANLYDLSKQANEYRGASDSDIPFLEDYKGVHFKHMMLKEDALRAVDDFFTRYGYRVERLGIPSLRNRENYTYIKTRNFAAKGNIPESDYVEIQNIFNNGVMWWTNINNIGDYSVRNLPV